MIVCDMWLTGFDAPCLHTMYIDKPMKGHNLMQAIARINRVYFEKQGEPYELAFYDALAQNRSAQDVMGVDQLRELARVN